MLVWTLIGCGGVLSAPHAHQFPGGYARLSETGLYAGIATTHGASDLGAVMNVPAQIRSLTGDDIQRAAQTYLDTSKYVKVTLMPAAGR